MIPIDFCIWRKNNVIQKNGMQGKEEHCLGYRCVKNCSMMNILLNLLKLIQSKHWFADITVGLLPQHFKYYKN